MPLLRDLNPHLGPILTDKRDAAVESYNSFCANALRNRTHPWQGKLRGGCTLATLLLLLIPGLSSGARDAAPVRDL